MTREEVISIIEETAKEYHWELDETLKYLGMIGFTVDNVVDNDRFTAAHVKMSLDFAHHALT